MDKKIANNVIVGAVVTIGFLGFLFVLFNVGGGTGVFSSTYPLYARFTHVKGLHYGSEVSLAGLRVGVVKTVNISKDNPKELVIEMSVENRMADKIREDSMASIKTQGVLGDKYIEIAIGSPESPVMKSGGFIRTEEAEDIFSKSGELVDDVKRHFGKDSDLDALLKNLNVLAGNLAILTADAKREKGLLNEMIYGQSGQRVSKATYHLSEILRKIDEGEGTLGALVNDPTVYEDLKSMMGGAKRSNVLKYFMRSFMDEGGKEEAPPPKK